MFVYPSKLSPWFFLLSSFLEVHMAMNYFINAGVVFGASCSHIPPEDTYSFQPAGLALTELKLRLPQYFLRFTETEVST